MDITAATPVQIDTQLAEIYGRAYQVQVHIADAERMLERARKSRFASDAERIVPLEDKIQELSATYFGVIAEASPYETEFRRRGGWTRAFLVENNGGHVHRDRACSTCRSTTVFTWVVEFSGTTEAEVVDAAGERACTVCYPSAPAEVRNQPSRILTAKERVAKATAEEKAVKQAAKDAAAVLDPETGKVLFKTDRGASNYIASQAHSSLWYDRPLDEVTLSDDPATTVVAKALAAKTGADAQELLDAALAKAQKKVDAELRKSAKTADNDFANWYEHLAARAKELGLTA